MSNLWWLQPGWTETLCGNCGKKIWPEGDPDHGLCWECWQDAYQRDLEAKQYQREDALTALDQARASLEGGKS